MFFVINSSACWINAPFEETFFEAKVTNESDHAVLVKLISAARIEPVIDSTLIQPNSMATICGYQAIGFAGFRCAVSGLEFRFENDRGYICIKGSNLINVSDSCFLNKDPLEPTINADENGTIFVVSQEDYENAWEL